MAGTTSGKKNWPAVQTLLTVHSVPKPTGTRGRVVNYPDLPVPENCVGLHVSGSNIQNTVFPKLRPIPKAPDCSIWGSPSLTQSKAMLTERVTPENETFIRSCHPSLAPAEHVSIGTELDGRCFWIRTMGSKTGHSVQTHVAGWEVHFYPQSKSTMFEFIYRRIPDPLNGGIVNPRRFLSNADLDKLREAYPESVGARILFTGTCTVLYKDDSYLQSVSLNHVPSSFGGLLVLFDVVSTTEYSGGAIEPGSTIAALPDSEYEYASVGLKLKLPGGLQAITVPTHPFVKFLETRSPTTLKIADWCLWAKAQLLKYRPFQWSQAISSFVSGSLSQGNSSLGKKVWVAGTRERVRMWTVSNDIGYL